jgi:hypothetical protein
MSYLVAHYWLPALVALIVGIAVGWWNWFPEDVRRRTPPDEMDGL